jgi:hypothetical protein
MGIYSDGKVYGVQLYVDEVKIFEDYSEINEIQIQSVKRCYDGLTFEEKEKLHILFYMSYSTTYSIPSVSMKQWIPVNVLTFEKMLPV